MAGGEVGPCPQQEARPSSGDFSVCCLGGVGLPNKSTRQAGSGKQMFRTEFCVAWLMTEAFGINRALELPWHPFGALLTCFGDGLGF